MTATDELIADFFGAEVTRALTDPKAVAEHRRRELLRVCDEHIEAIKVHDQAYVGMIHALAGTLATGAMAIAGWFDKDGAEGWRWIKEQVVAMSAEDLLDLEFEA